MWCFVVVVSAVLLSGVVELEAVLSVVVMSVVVLSVVVVSAVVFLELWCQWLYFLLWWSPLWFFLELWCFLLSKNIQIFTKLCLACIKYKMQLIALNKKNK